MRFSRSFIAVAALTACGPGAGDDADPPEAAGEAAAPPAADARAAPDREGSATVPSPDARVEAWACDGLALGVAAGAAEAILYLPDRTLRLPHVPAASGVKYESDTALFWTRGEEAMVELEGRSYDGCRLASEESPWVAARVRGARFRAIGQEPGWYVEIFPERTHVVADYGEIELALPPPDLERDKDGRVRALTWATEAHAVTIRIERTVCADGMSGFESPLTIRLTLDGRALDGCGRELGPAFLGDWRIARLGPASPHPAEGSGAPRIRLGAWTTAAGTTGCNRMSGEWTSASAGDVRFGPLATTRRACPPDLMAQESRVLESLATVRGYRTTADTLLLLGPDGDALLDGDPRTALARARHHSTRPISASTVSHSSRSPSSRVASSWRSRSSWATRSRGVAS